MWRLSETTELSMEKIHHLVLQFVHGTGNLLRQGQFQIKRGISDQQHLTNTSIVKGSLLIILQETPCSWNYQIQQCTRSYKTLTTIITLESS